MADPDRTDALEAAFRLLGESSREPEVELEMTPVSGHSLESSFEHASGESPVAAQISDAAERAKLVDQFQKKFKLTPTPEYEQDPQDQQRFRATIHVPCHPPETGEWATGKRKAMQSALERLMRVLESTGGAPGSGTDRPAHVRNPSQVDKLVKELQEKFKANPSFDIVRDASHSDYYQAVITIPGHPPVIKGDWTIGKAGAKIIALGRALASSSNGLASAVAADSVEALAADASPGSVSETVAPLALAPSIGACPTAEGVGSDIFIEAQAPVAPTASLDESGVQHRGRVSTTASLTGALGGNESGTCLENIPENFEEIYTRGGARVEHADVEELVAAFEMAPGAAGFLTVQKIFRARPDLEKTRDRKSEWELRAKSLQAKADEAEFPKPTWLAADVPSGMSEQDRTVWACERREREEVLWDLLSRSQRMTGLPDVWTARFYHGCEDLVLASRIFRTGFASNIQRTKGWFGEGVYATTSATYGLRYALGMQDFWESPGKTGVVIAGRAVFANVYPVTQLDNDQPLEPGLPSEPGKPGLKGKRIASAPGARGCDAHYVCVRGWPPHGEHKNTTYHACAEGERPDGNELVVSQEAQYLPEYTIVVKVGDSAALSDVVGLAARSWGRGVPRQPQAATAPAPSGVQEVQQTARGCQHKNNLFDLFQKRMKRPAAEGDIMFKETPLPDGQWKSEVRMLAFSELAFTGEPQVRRQAAQQSAAFKALRWLEANLMEG